MFNYQKVKALKNIVNTYFNTSIDSRTRTDKLIKARAIAYKILRDECRFSYTFIAQQFSKNHATVMHAIKEFPWMLKSDKNMERDYYHVLALWQEQSGEYVDLNPVQLKKQLNDLHEQNKMLNLSLIDFQERCEELKKHHKKYASLVQLIEERVPEKRIKEVEKKLNAILNGI